MGAGAEGVLHARSSDLSSHIVNPSTGQSSYEHPAYTECGVTFWTNLCDNRQRGLVHVQSCLSHTFVECRHSDRGRRSVTHCVDDLLCWVCRDCASVALSATKWPAPAKQSRHASRHQCQIIEIGCHRYVVCGHLMDVAQRISRTITTWCSQDSASQTKEWHRPAAQRKTPASTACCHRIAPNSSFQNILSSTTPSLTNARVAGRLLCRVQSATSARKPTIVMRPQRCHLRASLHCAATPWRQPHVGGAAAAAKSRTPCV